MTYAVGLKATYGVSEPVLYQEQNPAHSLR